MKSTYALIVFFTILAAHLFSQNQPTITEENRQNSKGNFNALVMELPGKISDADFVRNEWLRFVKKYKGKTSYNKKTDECFSDNAKIKSMSDNTVDITVKVISKDAQTLELIIWYNLGITYLSSKEYSEGIAVAETMLNDFAKLVYINNFKEILREEESLLKTMNRTLSSTKKEGEKFEKRISDYEDEIEKIKKKIVELKEEETANKSEQQKQKAEIDKQEKKIIDVKKEIDNLKKKRR